MAKRAASTAAKPRRASTRSRAASPPPATPDIEYGTEYINDGPEYYGEPLRPEPQYAPAAEAQYGPEPVDSVYGQEPEAVYYERPHRRQVRREIPIRERYDDGGGMPRIVQVAIGVVLVLLCIACAAFVYGQLSGGPEVQPDNPKPSAPAELIAQVDRATAGPGQEAAATYLGKFCRGLGNQLRTDAKNSPADYDTKGELAAIVGIAGNRVTSNDLTKAYRELPAIFEGLQRRAFGEEPMAGPASREDVLRFAEEWTTLGDAFLAVAE